MATNVTTIKQLMKMEQNIIIICMVIYTALSSSLTQCCKGDIYMKFETSKVIDKWVENHRKKCKSHTTAGEQFIYEFLPSGIVECQIVKCMICKEKFTDYVD
jgi:hypothetical protein